MTLSRRRLLWFGGGLAAGMSLAALPARPHNGSEMPTRSPVLRKFVDPLRRLGPALQPSGALDGSPLYEIAARSFRQRLHRDLPPTPLWGYGGRFPGPTIEVRRGRTNFRSLAERARGGSVPHPAGVRSRICMAPMAASRRPRWSPTCTAPWCDRTAMGSRTPGSPLGTANADRSGPGRRTSIRTVRTLARSGITTMPSARRRLNVYAGLAGTYLIRDDEEDALGLPSGDYEVLLIIQDRSFAADGSLAYPVSELAGSTDHPGPGCRNSSATPSW